MMTTWPMGRFYQFGFVTRDLDAAIERIGLDTPLKATVMDGHLGAVYGDTRALLGVFTDYVSASPARR